MKETKLTAKWDSEEGVKAHADLKAAAKMIIKKKPAHHASTKVKAVKKVMSAKISHELKGLKKLRKHQAEYKKKLHHDADSILKAALVNAHGKHESKISVKKARKNMVKIATQLKMMKKVLRNKTNMINKLAKKTFGEKNKSVKALNSKVILLKKHHHAIAHKKHTGARKAIKHAKKKIVFAKKTHKAYKKGKATKHEAKKAEKSAKKAIKKVIKAHPKYVAHVAIRKANKKVHFAKIMKWHYKHGLVSKHALKKAVHNAQKAIHKARKLAKSSKVLHKHKSHHHAAVHHAAKKHHKKAPNGFPVSQHGWSNWEKKQDSFLKAN
jgi:hypothetical protein